MVKVTCCYIRSNNAACNVDDMCKLSLVVTIIITALLIGSGFMYFTYYSLHACWECPRFDNRNFTGYDSSDQRCFYMGKQTGKKTHETRVYNASCEKKVMIGVSVGVSTLILILFILTLTSWRAHFYYDRMNDYDCDCCCTNLCFDRDIDRSEYPETGRCCFNLKILGKSLLFSIVVTILILTSPITVPIAVVCLLIWGIGYGCYFCTSKFCPFTCDICTFSLAVTKEKDGHVEMPEQKPVTAREPV